MAMNKRANLLGRVQFRDDTHMWLTVKHFISAETGQGQCCGRTRKGNVDDYKERGSGASFWRRTDLRMALGD